MRCVGVIPAAGRATRLFPLVYPKELLPIAYREADGTIRPQPVLQASLEQMRRAGIERCVIVVAEHKLEIARVFGDGAALGMQLAYVIQQVPRGLGDAIDAARPWVDDCDVCLALPDTLISPPDAFARIVAERAASGADLVLGVFPTDKPEQLGPVRVDERGNVTEVLDKPATTDVRNTWGIAVWSPAFTSLLARELESARDLVLGAVFQRAVERRLRVRAVVFDGGEFLDVGTPQGLAAALVPRPA